MTIPEVPGFSFNRAMGEDSEAVGEALIARLLPRIDEAYRKLSGEYVAVVEDRSSLRLDDRYLGAWRTGSLHGTAMSAAGDALLTIKTVLEPVLSREGALPMSALYPMIRAALESASLAIYLLHPEERDERLRRSFLVAEEDAKYQGTFADSMGSADWADIKAAARAEIRALIGTRPSLGPSADFVFSGVTYTLTVELAETVIAADTVVVRSGPRIPLLAWWKLLSGLSHGKQWAFVAAMERSEAIVDIDNQSAHIRVTSSIAAVALALERAVETLEVALRLFGYRSKATYAQIEDATEPPTQSYSEMHADASEQ